MGTFRGSRLHVLDWVTTEDFPEALTALVAPTGAVITHHDHWLPAGLLDPVEARMETFAAKEFPGLGKDLRAWWLAHPRGANTPNWDLASTCTIGDRRGLVLVEAKANVPELSSHGKRNSGASAASLANEARIAVAIGEARVALAADHPAITIRHDSHYQLSNRVAFAWKIAALGVPVVLMYLGFTGDTGVAGVGAPLRDGAHWQDEFEAHANGIGCASLRESKVACGQGDFWMIVRHRATGVSVGASPRSR